MGGLGSLFKKIIPIIMLVCFICLGITHTFQQVGQNNITYLTQQVYTENGEWKSIENATQEEIDNGHTAYKLDINSYMQNININILKDATNNAIDTTTYLNTLNSFKEIWEDGYQLFDGVHTLLNAVILVINTVITIINFAIIPIRIIAGLLLTGISLVGININTNSIIINSLRACLTILSIPLLRPAFSSETDYTLINTDWKFLNNPDLGFINEKRTYKLKFTSNGNSCNKIIVYNNKIEYGNFASKVVVYTTENGWTDNNWKTIHIKDSNNFTTEETQNILTFLQTYCANTTLANTTWLFPINPIIQGANEYDALSKRIDFVSNNTTFRMFEIYYSKETNGTTIYYVNKNTNELLYVYQNGTWLNDAYRTITFTQDAELNWPNYETLNNYLTNYCTRIS